MLADDMIWEFLPKGLKDVFNLDYVHRKKRLTPKKRLTRLCGANVMQFYRCKNPQATEHQFLADLLGDSVGARTQDLLLRRQLLYPAELPNHPLLNSDAKVNIFSDSTKFQTLNLI